MQVGLQMNGKLFHATSWKLKKIFFLKLKNGSRKESICSPNNTESILLYLTFLYQLESKGLIYKSLQGILEVSWTKCLFLPPNLCVEALTPKGPKQTPLPFCCDPCPSLNKHHNILIMRSRRLTSRTGAFTITTVGGHMDRNKDKNEVH